MFSSKKPTGYCLELTHGGKKCGKLEHLAPSLSIQEVMGLVKAKLQLSDKHAVRLMVSGGRTLGEPGMVLSDVPHLKTTTKVLVISSVPVVVEQPVDAPGDASFGLLEEELAAAEHKFLAVEEQGKKGGEELKASLLWFNSVVNILTKLDTLKETCRVEYDRNERGRTLIKRCNVLLDKVEQKKKTLL